MAKKENEYTELELSVIEGYRWCLYEARCFFIGDVDGDPKVMRGVLASLVKKGLISSFTAEDMGVDEDGFCVESFGEEETIRLFGELKSL